MNFKDLNRFVCLHLFIFLFKLNKHTLTSSTSDFQQNLIFITIIYYEAGDKEDTVSVRMANLKLSD